MRLAINGYGRIGRCVLRACYERGLQRQLSIVAINELASAEALSYLTRYDSTHGKFPFALECDGEELRVDGDRIVLCAAADASSLPWAELGIDLVLECSGQQGTESAAGAHLQAGARQVLLSNPGEPPIPALVYGINHESADCNAAVLSAASCTSNALTPVLAVLDRAFGIHSGVVTTLHASMHDQPVIDAYHSEDLRRNRAATQSIIPVDTALAQGVGRILPALGGKLVAHALRVPINNVSALNITLNLEAETTVEAINETLAEAASTQLQGVMGYCEEPLASCDFNHDPRSCIVDARQTQLIERRTANLLVWFDNEWAFANRMLDLAQFLNAQADS